MTLSSKAGTLPAQHSHVDTAGVMLGEADPKTPRVDGRKKIEQKISGSTKIQQGPPMANLINHSGISG